MFRSLFKVIHSSLIVFLLVGLVSFSAEAVERDASLSVHYSFDGEGETVVDSSTYGNNGTVKGSLERAEGVYEQALVFDGSTTWVDMNGPEFKNAPVDGFTLAFWVNHTGPAGSQSVFDAVGTDHGSGLFHVEIETGNERVRWFHRDGTQTTIFSIRQGPAIEPNKWVHFAGTYDSESGDVKTYFDGEETNTATGNGKMSDNWGVRAGIGHHNNDRWLSGLLDEFYMFSRALSEDEVMEVMNGILLSVEPEGKLATTWGSIKSQR